METHRNCITPSNIYGHFSLAICVFASIWQIFNLGQLIYHKLTFSANWTAYPEFFFVHHRVRLPIRVLRLVHIFPHSQYPSGQTTSWFLNKCLRTSSPLISVMQDDVDYLNYRKHHSEKDPPWQSHECNYNAQWLAYQNLSYVSHSANISSMSLVEMPFCRASVCDCSHSLSLQQRLMSLRMSQSVEIIFLPHPSPHPL